MTTREECIKCNYVAPLTGKFFITYNSNIGLCCFMLKLCCHNIGICEEFAVKGFQLYIKRYYMTLTQISYVISTAWKVGEYSVFYGPYFPTFGLTTKIYIQTLFMRWVANLKISSKPKNSAANKKLHLKGVSQKIQVHTFHQIDWKKPLI